MTDSPDYVWADDPERHLADWADQPGHAVDYARVTDVLLDGTHDEWWMCVARDAGTGHTFQGRANTRPDAAFVTLTRLCLHALEQARTQQQTP